MTEKCKCQFPRGITIKPDGVHELDACVYQVQEIHKNVTVTVSRCRECGSIDISWERQADTIDIEEDYQAMDDLID